MKTTGHALGGIILLAAGLYQFTSIKSVCLRHCQNPILFLSQHWRAGAGGTFRMGMHHGAYCLGCCWFLMALLFFGGIMNLLWIAGIALYIAFEKLAPAGVWISRIAGAILVVAGGVTLAQMTTQH